MCEAVNALICAKTGLKIPRKIHLHVCKGAQLLKVFSVASGEAGPESCQDGG